MRTMDQVAQFNARGSLALTHREFSPILQLTDVRERQQGWGTKCGH